MTRLEVAQARVRALLEALTRERTPDWLRTTSALARQCGLSRSLARRALRGEESSGRALSTLLVVDGRTVRVWRWRGDA